MLASLERCSVATNAHSAVMQNNILVSVRACWLTLKPGPCGALTGSDFLSNTV